MQRQLLTAAEGAEAPPVHGQAVGAANPPLVKKTNEVSKCKEQNPKPSQLQWYISTGPTTCLYFLTTATFQLSLPRKVQRVPLKCEYSVTYLNSSFPQFYQ